MSENICPYDDASLVVVDYLAGRLSEAKTRAFEAHAFACDRCFAELQTGSELRSAADAGDVRVANSAAVRPRWAWTAVGLAASVVLALGVWLSRPLTDAPGPPDPVYRDGGDAADLSRALEVEITRDNGGVALRWTEVAGADLYQVSVFTEAGDPLFERQTRETRIALSPEEWRGSGASGRLYAQVIALDELRQSIVQSEYEPL